jgi:hypothetical protein
MRKTLLPLIMLLLVIVFIAGCGDTTVTGKVTFPDGTPLTTGQVMFQKEGFVASGNLRPDGTYSAGKLKDGDGLPPGRYQVFITGATTFGGAAPPPPAVSQGGPPPANIAKPVFLIDPKYTVPHTSGLTVDVNGKTEFNIKVEPPK